MKILVRNSIYLIVFSLTVFITNWSFAQSVGISGSAITPDAQSILDIQSTTKGVLLPRMTTAQATTLAASLNAADAGMTIYDTDIEQYKYWDGTALQWQIITNNGSIPTTNDYIANNTVQQVGANFNIDGDGTLSDLAITGGDITSAGLLKIGSTTDVRIRLDTDANGSEEFQVTNNGGTTPVLTVTEAGNLTATGNGEFDGNITLSGNDRDLKAANNFDITGTSGIDIQVDSDGNSANSEFRILNDNFLGDELFKLQEDGGIFFSGLAAAGTNILQADVNGQVTRTTVDPTGIITGTGTPTQVAYFDGTQTITSESNLFWDPTNDRLGIGTVTPGAKLDVAGHMWQTGTGQSVFVGEGAGANDDLSTKQNVFVGYMAGNANTTGGSNTASGANGLAANTTGAANTAFGRSSLLSNTTGNNNTASGFTSLATNTTGASNTASGTSSLLSNTTGSNNTASGASSLLSNTTGSSNTANGAGSLFYNTTGVSNTATGYRSLYSNTTGYRNTAIGYEADVSANNLTNATAIGYNAKVATSNSLVLGGTGVDAVNVGIGTTTPTNELDVNGQIRMRTGATVGYVPVADANGVMTWTNPNSLGVTGNTLDEAYDQGGAGAGRIITADNGAIEIQGVGGLNILGNVGIGNNIPAYALDVSGDMGVDNSIFHNGDNNTGISFTPDRIQLFAGSTASSWIDIQSSASELAINENNLNRDFRVEGGTDANLLFVDGGNNNVGIGNNSPDFKLDVSGYAAANNMVTIIPLWQAGSNYFMNNTAGTDLANCESGINPDIYNASGNLEVKLVVRVTSTSGGTVGNFQLRTHDGTTQAYPIVNTDAWTWAATQNGYVVTSPWKAWNAGTNAHELHLHGWVSSGASLNFNSAYLMIRSQQN